MRFNPIAMDRHINNIGQEVRWSQAYACSCVNPGSGAPDPKCKACFGKGWMWPASVDTVVGLSGQKVQMQWEKSGLFQAGDLVVTVPGNSAMWEAGLFDRMIMMNASDRFSLPLTRDTPSERLPFTVEAVERAFVANKVTGAITDVALPVINAAGRPEWPEGGGPAPGVSYSLTGKRRSEYFIYNELPSSRNEHSGMRLPKRVVLRRWDLFGR